MDHADQQASATWRVSPDMMCFFHADGTFASVNPAWHRTLGWAPDELVGEPYIQFVHPDDVERSQEAFGEILAGRPVLRFENRYRHRDGGYRWLSWVAVPEDDMYFCSARDITIDREQARTIETQQEEASLREQFLAIIGHDLRNPLAALGSGLTILERRSEEESLLPIIKQMRSSVTRMNELIDNIMDFARVRLGDGIGLDIGEHDDLGESIARVIAEVSLVTPGLKYNFDNQSTRPVRCDASRVQQVVSNLLANAASHGDWDKPVQVVFCTKEDHFFVEVANGGDGMSANARQNLFQPFFRGEPEESKQGLGLGLYIVSEIVKAHDGRIDVESDDLETRFSLCIPG
ncbi:PAS domain-containing sensor histidine kinase [Aurantiacibacter sp. MUD61]|uniref:PAS domain-containing sensor histidine kinase n=1 Tax=Aurantiacibacter sp. MUD61 TaxID=3009083 RepID=UPI0022F02659|nr:PAS domain-containing sensor histidine kinase [Aurantiacibacter sp. MUD61]